MIRSLAKCVVSTAAAAVLAATLFLTLVPMANATLPLHYGNIELCGGTECGCITLVPPYNCAWMN